MTSFCGPGARRGPLRPGSTARAAWGRRPGRRHRKSGRPVGRPGRRSTSHHAQGRRSDGAAGRGRPGRRPGDALGCAPQPRPVRHRLDRLIRRQGVPAVPSESARSDSRRSRPWARVVVGGGGGRGGRRRATTSSRRGPWSPGRWPSGAAARSPARRPGPTWSRGRAGRPGRRRMRRLEAWPGSSSRRPSPGPGTGVGTGYTATVAPARSGRGPARWGRRQVLRVDPQPVAPSAGEVEGPVGVPVGQVPGPVPPVPGPRRGGVLVAVVALEAGVTARFTISPIASVPLTRRPEANSAGGHSSGSRVDDGHVLVGRRAPTGVSGNG